MHFLYESWAICRKQKAAANYKLNGACTSGHEPASRLRGVGTQGAVHDETRDKPRVTLRAANTVRQLSPQPAVPPCGMHTHAAPSLTFVPCSGPYASMAFMVVLEANRWCLARGARGAQRKAGCDPSTSGDDGTTETGGSRSSLCASLRPPTAVPQVCTAGAQEVREALPVAQP